MTYDLALGDYAYSSWSLRGWLLLHRFGLPYRVHLAAFDRPEPVGAQLPDFAPSRLVPALRTPGGTVIWDSLAMAEELATRHPEAHLWPTDSRARAIARSLSAEMHSGFAALRSACPMNLRQAFGGVAVSADVSADLDRIAALWEYAQQMCGTAGPWLCGDYSAVDAFFAPVAARIAGYDLPVPDSARAYVAAHLADPAFRRWRAMALVRGATLTRYAQPWPTGPWPGPAPTPARAVDTGTPENDRCPYSGDPVTHLMETGGRIFGFCNAFCRDKTVADPDAWDAFVALRDS